MVGLPFSRHKLQWCAWHKWVGITLWLLTCGRPAWRWRHPSPADGAHAGLATARRRFTHALLVAIALSGWIVPLGDWRAVHVTLNFTLLALVCIHGAAAPKHHCVDRDAVLIRMLPRSWNLRGSLSVP